MSSTSPPLPRRSFAIISHPDAGKTTLTEKLLLYGGAVQLAGSVTARKNQRATTSDWMELERQRGISISSTVLQFDYAGHRINLLDTPGHKDFSEDTYRVLTAVDAAVMVIDAGKGIEPQTRKLFEVCRQRGIPIFTFMNKCDRPTRDPLELLDELESVLGIGAFPVNWPLGTGPDFRGVYDRLTKTVHVFERTTGGARAAPVMKMGVDDPKMVELLGESLHRTCRDEIEMLEGAGEQFDQQAVLDGKITPVFFGSAMNNFGVQLMLEGYLKHSGPPTPRRSMGMSVAGAPAVERIVGPSDAPFSGFVFKIQANMDPRHRDRIAFLRIVSGVFRREMSVVHVQSGDRVRLSNAQKLFGQERETVEEAYPGDVVGLVGNDKFGIGDTLSEDRTICYREIPRFPPECFALLHNPQPSNYKRFRQGLDQLLREGVVQSLDLGAARAKVPVLAAVGPLQFEVVQFRLKSEYNAESRLDHAPWSMARWCIPPVQGDDEEWQPDLPDGAALAKDPEGRTMILFTDDWTIRNFQRRYPEVELTLLPKEPGTAPAPTGS
jgi:peptide chain release factor 3